MKTYIRKHRRAVGIAGVVIAFMVAGVYLYIKPEEASAAEGIRKALLLYAHSTCWALLGLACLVWSRERLVGLSQAMTWAALGVYVLFLTALFI